MNAMFYVIELIDMSSYEIQRYLQTYLWEFWTGLIISVWKSPMFLQKLTKNALVGLMTFCLVLIKT